VLVKDRVVEPEILDELSVDDPRAVRSRRDLRMINFLMGNERWILRQLRERLEPEETVVELGAGRGEFTRQLMGLAPTVGLDLCGKPTDFEGGWQEGDLFETLPEVNGEAVVANLILHHFKKDRLAELGELLEERRLLVMVEPWRSRVSLFEGYTLFPLIGEVTRYDMMVSIRAGFRRGELLSLLGLDSQKWEWRESVSLLGGYRVVAWRR